MVVAGEVRIGACGLFGGRTAESVYIVAKYLFKPDSARSGLMTSLLCNGGFCYHKIISRRDVVIGLKVRSREYHSRCMQVTRNHGTWQLFNDNGTNSPPCLYQNVEVLCPVLTI